jgi:hypothetical protein
MRLQEISTEISNLLDQQSRLLNGDIKLSEMSGDEIALYRKRAQRLTQLSEELNEIA